MPYIPRTPKKSNPRTAKYGERQDIYNTKRWRELRISKLMSNPLCEICELEKGEKNPTLATEVHHIDSFLNYDGMMREYKAFDFNNLLSVCRNCHTSKCHNRGIYSNCKTKEEIRNIIDNNKNKKKDKR